MAGFKPVKDWLNKLAEKMKQNKKLELLVYGALILLGVLIYFSLGAGGSQAPKTASAEGEDAGLAAAQDEREVEARLREVLSHIRGAGSVEVMITYDTGREIVPAMSVDVETSSTETVNGFGGSMSESRQESEKPMTVSQNGSNETIVLKEKQPTVRGVIVIAEGAADITVRMNLQNAVKTVLGIDGSCIEVFEMGRETEEGKG